MSTFLENYLESTKTRAWWSSSKAHPDLTVVVFFEGVSTLPVELQRNFNLMKELDEQSAGLLTLILVLFDYSKS
jgi:hypothetical protein